MDLLWEHFVLNEIQAHLQTRRILYWRDKRGHEIDFVLIHNKRPKPPLTIECKWSSSNFDAGNIKAFRKQYPAGINYVVAANIDRSYTRTYDDVAVKFVNLPGLIQEIKQ